MANVVKLISTRSFFQLGAELKREKYNHNNADFNAYFKALLLAVVIAFIFFVWAVYALIKHSRDLPNWVVIVSIILLLLVPGGSLITLALVYFTLWSNVQKGAKGREMIVEEDVDVDVEEDGGASRERFLQVRPPNGNSCPFHQKDGPFGNRREFQ